MSYATNLERDLGVTPVFVRYNSGRHISENGQDLAQVIAALVDAWPVPVEEISLVGHSMGGLVARSCASYADRQGQPWLSKLRRVVAIGSPHLGAPLEKGANALAYILRAIDAAGAQVPAEILELRSAGIKDLRFGYTVNEEWANRDPDAFLDDNRLDLPFVDSAGYYVVAGTLTQDPAHPLGQLLGDVLVRPPSAQGVHPESTRRIPFQVGSVHGGISHLALANHPDVYPEIRKIFQEP